MIVPVPGGVRRMEDPFGNNNQSTRTRTTRDPAEVEGSRREPTKEEIIKGLLKPLPMLAQAKKRSFTDQDKGPKYSGSSQPPIPDQFDLSEGVSVMEGNRTRNNFRPNPMSLTTASDFSKNNNITKKAYAMLMTQQGGFSSNSINETLQEKRFSSETAYRSVNR